MENRHEQLQPKKTKTVATTKLSQLSVEELSHVSGGPGTSTGAGSGGGGGYRSL